MYPFRSVQIPLHDYVDSGCRRSLWVGVVVSVDADLVVEALVGAQVIRDADQSPLLCDVEEVGCGEVPDDAIADGALPNEEGIT